VDCQRGGAAICHKRTGLSHIDCGFDSNLRGLEPLGHLLATTGELSVAD
jgi:hypothetical protein